MEQTASSTSTRTKGKKPRASADIYTVRGTSEVMCGRTVVARMYVDGNGEQELRILQGMPRVDTITKLLADCPEFCQLHAISATTYPRLFSA